MAAARLTLGWLINMKLVLALLVLLGDKGSSSISIISQDALKCSRQDLDCRASCSNCMDPGWLISHKYTPSGPDNLQVAIETRLDKTGKLQPVLQANWTLKDDGSIHFLNATELHVLRMSTNEQLCIRYSFKNILTMRSPSEEKWLFSSDVLVLNPGEEYYVSVYNIPRPEQGHSNFDVNRQIQVPGCEHPNMKKTQLCIERGSLWKPNISLVHEPVNSSLAVSFSPSTMSKKYLVLMRCGSITDSSSVLTENQETVNVKFSLHKWPRFCCQFDAEIKPFFPQCDNDCTRQRKTDDICTEKTPQTDLLPPEYLFVPIAVVSICIIVAAVMCVICRKRGKHYVAPPSKDGETLQTPLKPQPKVLVIYSQDHHLYREVVLKLCAFLQAKCGTRVLVDLLDTSSVSMVGRLRWLEWQRQQLNNPSDKILVLCSPGVQAKWRSMCGQGQVKLKEDVLCPTDDILIPFLNLFLPDMHQAGMLGRYMVAYFGDISSERDVPSVFDIGIKYNLMKHFEELYFRILDIEKYQPGQVSHIEGIGVDEYSSCASGKALRDAIETFQAYQIENPDWFEKECVLSEEEVISEANQLIEPLQTLPVFEYIPPIRDGLPVYIHNVDINESCSIVHILTPELNPEQQLSSVAVFEPAMNSDCRRLYSPSQVEVLTEVPLYHHSTGPESAYIAEPVFRSQSSVQQNWVSLREPSSVSKSAEEDEASLQHMNERLYAYSDQLCLAQQNFPDTSSLGCPSSVVQSENIPLPELSLAQPVEMEEEEDFDPGAKRSSGESDQGYSSKGSSQHETPLEEDPVKALARLQEELFQMPDS
ncbi:interleukin 17 receptor A1a [Poecilia reticulata]|uniref:Interleukin 17 receptor A n=1 Tax=Poecilia reticulata TaxID=8081 RepID=A0A3P9PW37_POERE|nr:PREDICTED: interleukin-17 receptor A [Poecilia reticulata]